MLNIVVNKLITVLQPSYKYICFFNLFRIPEIYKEPSKMPILMIDILEVIIISLSIHVSVCIGREMQVSIT